MSYYSPMTEPALPPAFMEPIRIGEHPALDFANTLAAPAGEAVDFIAQPQAFVAWAQGTAGTAQVHRLALEARQRGELEQALVEVRALRDWLRAQLPRIAAGKALGDAKVLASLNRTLAAGACHWRLSGARGQAVLTPEPDYNGPASVAAALAVPIAELLAQVSPDTVRKCENPACMLWFRDTSKRGNRRWCSMAACGNRAKAAAHRQRHKAGD